MRVAVCSVGGTLRGVLHCVVVCVAVSSFRETLRGVLHCVAGYGAVSNFRETLGGVLGQVASAVAGARVPFVTLAGRTAGVVCCSMLQCVASQCVAVCCGVLRCVAVCCGGIRVSRSTRALRYSRRLHRRCSVLQRVAVCCGVVQYVAVYSVGLPYSSCIGGYSNIDLLYKACDYIIIRPKT